MKTQRHHHLPPLAAAGLLGLAAAAVLPLAPPAARAQSVTTWAQSYGVGNYEPDGTPTDPGTVYPSSGNDLATGIAAMPDGGVVICGRLNLPETNANRQHANNNNGLATLVRYAADGSILWQQALRQNNDVPPPGIPDSQLVATNTAYQVQTDAQGNIFAYLDQSDRPGGGSDNIVVAKFSPAGALIWQNGFAGDKYADDSTNPPTVRLYGPSTGGQVSFDNSFSLTPDGGVILAAAENFGGFLTYPFYVKFNADGSLGVHRPFKNISQYPGFRAACQSADGSRILVTTSNSGTVLLTEAASGRLLAERTFHSDAGVLNYPQDIIVRALPLADNGFLLLGLDVGQYGQGLTLHRVDANLVPISSKVLQNITGTTLAPTSDGGYLLTGVTTDPTTGNVDVLLLKVDAGGNPVFARAIGGPKSEGLNQSAGDQVPLPSAVQTTDGGYAFTVSSFSYATGTLGRPDFWTVKTDANGHLPNFAGQADIPLSTFKAHDNTIPSEVTTTYDGSYPKNYTGDAATVTFGILPENLATNAGINRPNVMIQAAPVVSTGHLPFFNGEAALGNGVYYLQFPGGNPFGYYSYLTDPHYVYHQDLGYEYVFEAGDGRNGVFLYDFKSSGFFYTSPAFPFPYLYDFALNTVLYYFPDPKNPGRYNTDGVRYFSNLTTGQIISK